MDSRGQGGRGESRRQGRTPVGSIESSVTNGTRAPSLDGGAESGETTPVAVQHAGSLVSAEDSALGRRLVRYVDGGIFGELDFFLRHPRSFSAVASTPDTCVQVLTRDALQSMQSQAPQLAAALEHALLKYLSFQVNAKLGLSDGVSDASRHS